MQGLDGRCKLRSILQAFKVEFGLLDKFNAYGTLRPVAVMLFIVANKLTSSQAFPGEAIRALLLSTSR